MDDPTKMDPEIKAKWVEALRSGKYQQEFGGLGKGTKLCCLGVLSVVVQGRPCVLPWSEMVPNHGALIELNDGPMIDREFRGDKSFAEIADYIEANL
jgi:hypothetical protein